MLCRIVNIATKFQKKINRILQDLIDQGNIIYIDNIPIYYEKIE
jgi:hypothetical protein